jgi:hypothetical protein
VRRLSRWRYAIRAAHGAIVNGRAACETDIELSFEERRCRTVTAVAGRVESKQGTTEYNNVDTAEEPQKRSQ